jgi:hypothetical protein
MPCCWGRESNFTTFRKYSRKHEMSEEEKALDEPEEVRRVWLANLLRRRITYITRKTHYLGGGVPIKKAFNNKDPMNPDEWAMSLYMPRISLEGYALGRYAKVKRSVRYRWEMSGLLVCTHLPPPRGVGTLLTAELLCEIADLGGDYCWAEVGACNTSCFMALEAGRVRAGWALGYVTEHETQDGRYRAVHLFREGRTAEEMNMYGLDMQNELTQELCSIQGEGQVVGVEVECICAACDERRAAKAANI